MENVISTIVPTEHEKSEWSRMAQDCYGRDLNDYGHRYSAVASLRQGESISINLFDSLQENYRTWLIDGVSALPSFDVPMKGGAR